MLRHAWLERILCPTLLLSLWASAGWADPSPHLACRDPRVTAAVRAERSGNWPLALQNYRHALTACRGDVQLLDHWARARSRTVRAVVTEADRQAVAGNFAAARHLLLEALRLDPGAQDARQRLLQIEDRLGPSQTGPLEAAAPQLDPPSGLRSFDYRGDVMGAYQEVARQFGLSAFFDSELPHRTIRFRIAQVDFPTAMRLLGQMTGTTWRPLGTRTFFVFADTPAKRQQYGAAEVRTVLLRAAQSPSEMDELARALRDIAGLTRTHLDAATRTLTLEGPSDRVELAQRLADQLQQPPGEIVLEMDLLEVDRQQAEQMGLTPPSSAQMFTLTPSQIQQASRSLQGLLEVLTQLFGQPSALAGLDFVQIEALLSAGRLNLTSLLPPLVAFGGGRTRFLATLPGAVAQLAETLSVVRSGQRLLLRAEDGKPATLFVGERFPVLLNTYQPTLTAPAVVPTITTTNFPRSDFPVGTRPSAVASGDFDGDSFADLAVTNESDGTVSILLNDGAGDFNRRHDLPVGHSPVAVVAADVNGDGKLDLVVANRDDDTVSVLLGHGDGTFAPPQSYAVGHAPVAIAVADFNGDRHPDLAVANRDDNTISILINRGDGTFQPPFDLPVGRQPVALAAADLNGDGRPDLAVADQADNTVTVWLGVGDGTFANRREFPAGAAPTSLQIADFTGDGTPDLAVAARDDNAVALLVGNGDGSFQPPIEFATPTGPVALLAADFNLDGRPDLAVAAPQSNQASVLINNGAGNFTFRIDLAVGANPVAVAAADFDHNGLPDLAVANQTANTVSILFNDVGLVPGTATSQVLFPAFEYVDLGLKITLTPRLHPDEEATLAIRTEVTSLAGASLNGIPVLTHRSIEQQVRVRQGQPTLIAALQNPQQTLEMVGWPGLQTLGARNRQRQDTELLFIVRPRLVRAAHRQAVTIYAGLGRSWP